MINTRKTVRFYDDRNKVKEVLTLKTVLFQNENVCLCLVEGKGAEWDDSREWLDRLGEVLFRLDTGEVLNEELFAWIATDKKPPE